MKESLCISNFDRPDPVRQGLDRGRSVALPQDILHRHNRNLSMPPSMRDMQRQSLKIHVVWFDLMHA